MSQLRRLQSLVAKTTTKTAQAGTCVMVSTIRYVALLFLDISLFNTIIVIIINIMVDSSKARIPSSKMLVA